MLKKELAEALGISAAMVSKLVKRGMPTDSVDRAQRWRRRHLEPGRVKENRYDRAGRHAPDPVTRAVALGKLALSDFAKHEGDLRTALRAVPEDRQEEVSLHVNVWENLYGPEAIALLENGGDPADDARMTPAEIQEVDRILWALATGQCRVEPGPAI